MRIDYISASILPSRFANSVHVMKMCAAFAEHGHDVRLFGRRGEELSDDRAQDLSKLHSYYGVAESFAVKRGRTTTARFLWNLSYSLKVLNVVKATERPELFYGRYIYALALCAKSFPDVPVVFEAHSLPRNRIEKLLEAGLYRRPNFSHLVVISQALKDDYLATFPFLDAQKIRVAHDGADMVERNADEAVALKGEADLSKIGYAGKLTKGKGLALIAELAPLCPECEFHIWGGGSEDVTRWQSVFTANDAENVFLYGHVPHGDLDQYYQQADVLLAPLQEENVLDKNYDIGRWTSPLKLFEYMAHGKAIVASDIPVLREVLRSGENCLLAPPDDAQAWKLAIDDLLAHPDKAKAIGMKAQQELEETYSWKKRAENVLTK